MPYHISPKICAAYVLSPGLSHGWVDQGLCWTEAWFPQEGTIDVKRWHRVGDCFRDYYEAFRPTKIPVTAFNSQTFRAPVCPDPQDSRTGTWGAPRREWGTRNTKNGQQSNWSSWQILFFPGRFYAHRSRIWGGGWRRIALFLGERTCSQKQDIG